MDNFDKAFRLFPIFWFACFLAGIAFWGVVIWAIIEFTKHYT